MREVVLGEKCFCHLIQRVLVGIAREVVAVAQMALLVMVILVRQRLARPAL